MLAEAKRKAGKKIIIVGTTGSGKSDFSKKLLKQRAVLNDLFGPSIDEKLY